MQHMDMMAMTLVYEGTPPCDVERFIIFDGECIMCKKPIQVKVPYRELEAYDNGAMSQDAFKSLSKDDIELLKTGICPTCWDKMSPEEDDEGEGDV